jgi:hypothetical protein
MLKSFVQRSAFVVCLLGLGACADTPTAPVVPPAVIANSGGPATDELQVVCSGRIVYAATDHQQM